ncbi:MAG: RNA 2'-phosphotransferase [Chloroflexi bacterium]|nr:RNA 2'-phosphotransferase [Chloroflexota bacterium]
MHKRDTQLSKAISLALRHKPWLFELELDQDGWVDLDQLLAALRASRSYWADVSREDVERVMAHSDKQRFELQDDRIRALYGHSLPVRLQKTPASPPPVLFHGTTDRVLGLILSDGLKPMSRQYVHLSVDRETAVMVAQRKQGKLIVLQIDAERAYQDGIQFYSGNEAVWLADTIPPAYLIPLED